MQIPRLAMLCWLLIAAGPAWAAEPAVTEPLITLDLSGLNLQSAVTSLSVQSGRPFLVAGGTDNVVSGPDIKMSKVPLSTAIQTLSGVYGVCAVERPGITSFQSCESVRADESSKVRLGVALVSMLPESVYQPGGIVRSVLPDSVASRAGILREDIIVAFNGRAISRASELVDAVSRVEPGSAVAMEVLRGKQRLKLTAQF